MSDEQISDVLARGVLKVPEAAKMLNLSRSALYALMEKGDLAYLKIGGARRIPRAAIEDLARRCLVGV